MPPRNDRDGEAIPMIPQQYDCLNKTQIFKENEAMRLKVSRGYLERLEKRKEKEEMMYVYFN